MGHRARTTLARKRHTAEQITGKLREAEIKLAAAGHVERVAGELKALGASPEGSSSG